MSEAPWFASYPPGVPKHINPDNYSSLAGMLEDSFKKFGSRVAYENMGRELTFSEMDHLTETFASFLQNQLGLKKGDKIAIQMPNLLQNPICIWGALRAGLVVVNTNPLYTPGEMKHQFTDSETKAIVILENYACNLEKILSDTQIEHVIVTKIGDMIPGLKGSIINMVVKYVKKMVPSYNLPKAIPFKQVMKEGNPGAFQKPEIKNEDLAFLQYTGGTTGVSKGAMLTHRNLNANVQQARAWLTSGNISDNQEIFIAALPLYHIFALCVHGLVTANIGAKNVLITNPRDLPAFVKELGKHKYTCITGVNTLFNKLLNTPGFAEVDHSHIKVALAGGMALQRAVSDKWKEVTGNTIAEAYGLTETSPALCINPLNENAIVGSIGLPIPDSDVILIDDDGKEVGIGEKGELCCKGPQVTQGYWKREESNAESFINGYFKTGDIATMDEKGFFRIVDRKKEMILVSGFNVYPNEVEDAIAMHPKVLEVGAIGVPDKQSNEVVKVYVVKSDESLTAEELKAYCKENLTGYKCPKYVAFTDELPKSNVGKVLRRIIKEEDLKNNTYDA